MFPGAPAFRLLLLGARRRQQVAAAQALLVLAIYVLCALFQVVGVQLEMFERDVAVAVTAWTVTGGLVFYALLRSDVLRPHVADADLTVPQMLWAMAGISGAYAFVGTARAVPLLLMAVVLPFGSFSLSAVALRRMAAIGFSLLVTMMVWRSHTLPAVYAPKVELVHGVAAAIVMAVLAVVSIQLGRLHRQLRGQRAALQQAVKRIEALATRDELTGLLNRRAVLERMTGELRERGGTRPRLCVALVDLDHFKHVNDTFGHAAGDRVLRRFTELALEEIRAGDVLARWGGEEFLLLLPGAGHEQALRSLERMRARLRTSPIDEVASGLVVSFSAGVAGCESEADLEAAIDRADAAMYRAKQAGRDRVLCAE